MKAPVLILAAVPRMTTTVARSLHNYGIPVDVATFSPVEGRIPSRSIRNFYRVPDPDVSRQDFVDSMLGLIREYQHDMLIPGNDIGLTAIIENFDDFSRLLKVACPPPNVVKRVLDKNVTLEIAAQAGVRVPKTVLLCSTREIPSLARELGYPVIIKPGEKQRVEDFKTRVLRTSEEASKFFPEEREFVPPMLMQEFCTGVGVGIEILMEKGNCLAAFQHRRIKEFPHGGGVAVVAVAEAVEPSLLESSVRLLRALDWEGVAMVEFRVDPATGRSVLMEVNGRVWGSISLPVLSGMDFPLYQWQVMHGEQPEIPKQYAVGTRWRWTGGYLSRLNGMFLARLRGRLTASLLQEIVESRHDFGRATRDSLWNYNDPLPATYELLTTIRDLVKFDLKAIRGEFSRGSRVQSRERDSLQNPAKTSLKEKANG